IHQYLIFLKIIFNQLFARYKQVLYSEKLQPDRESLGQPYKVAKRSNRKQRPSSGSRRSKKPILIQDLIRFPPTYTKIKDITEFLLYEQGNLNPIRRY
ncbi:unnamed protein product, partial [Clonostachys chloroleuca]